MKIHYFGRLTDIVGTDNEDFELSQPLSLGIIDNKLKEKYPDLKKEQYLIFVNSSKANDFSLVLKKEDEISLMPPFSGG